MEHKNKKKKEPWRLIVGTVSIAYIVYMWGKNDIIATYAAMPMEQIIPLAATTIAVSFIKVVALAGGIMLLKRLIGKIKAAPHK